MHEPLIVDACRLLKDADTLGRLFPLLRELYSRRRHPLWTYQPDEHPDRPQKQFHRSTAGIVVVEGGNQSGKSRVLGQEAAWTLIGSHPYKEVPKGARIYVISAFFQTIQEGVWKHLQYLLPQWLIAERSAFLERSKVPQWIRLYNGAQVDFFSAQGGDEGRRKLQAADIDLAIVDEEVDESIKEELQFRLLRRNGRLLVGATLVRGEPWVIDLERRAESGDPAVELYRFSSVRAAEAGHISQEKLDEIMATCSEEMREVRVFGRSMARKELVYPEFKDKLHVCDPFTIPPGWTRYCALDHGWRTFAVLWAAVSPEGRYYLYREIYAHGKKYSDISERIFRAEGYRYYEEKERWCYDGDTTEKIHLRWIDPAAYAHSTSGEPGVAILMSGLGLDVCPAPNDIERGIELCSLDLEQGISGNPRFQVFRTCTNFIEEIIRYRRTPDTRDARKGERPDRPVKRHDHLLDCWRYLVLGGLEFKDPNPPQSPYPFYEFGTLPPKLAIQRALERARLKSRRDRPSPGGIGSEY